MDKKTDIRCPACGSDNVYRIKGYSKVSAISILLFMIPIPFISTKYHCFECGKDFKKKDLRSKEAQKLE